jgi:hypothetical protein
VLTTTTRFHFNSVAHDNASLSSKILTPSPGRIAPAPQVAASAEGLVTPTPVTLVGTQVVHKFSHNASGAPRPGHEGDAPDEVWIGLALWRVEVTVGGHAKKADVVVTCNVHANAENGTDEVAKTQKWLEDAVKTFKIVNWGLFADE